MHLSNYLPELICIHIDSRLLGTQLPFNFLQRTGHFIPCKMIILSNTKKNMRLLLMVFKFQTKSLNL